MKDTIIALEEEIGNADLFIGREAEMEFLLKWAERTKLRGSQSTAIIARRKKGKTSLVQRFYNILYTQNDSGIIPFYFKVRKEDTSKLEFSTLFYRSLLSQYFGHTKRSPGLIKRTLSLEELLFHAEGDEELTSDIQLMDELEYKESIDSAWIHAQEAGHRISGLKNQRIIQIIEEFHNLDHYIYRDENFAIRSDLSSSFRGVAGSKVSPQIITSSYCNQMGEMIQKMVGRYREYYLDNLTPEAGREAVTQYATFEEVEIRHDTAPFIAKVCYNDPYYIAQLFRSHIEKKDLTTEKGICEVLSYEATPGKGNLANIWLEYIGNAYHELNTMYSRRIVIYLSQLDREEERTRKEILEDLELEVTDHQLEDCLYNLVKAELIRKGSTNFHFRGWGDSVFSMIFRRIYEVEAEEKDLGEIERDFKQIMLQTKENRG